MSLTVIGGSSKILSADDVLAMLKTVDGVGSGLDADFLRGAPATPGGTAGVPMFGQVFAPQRASAYPSSLFRI